MSGKRTHWPSGCGEERYRRLAEARQVRPVAAVVARFNEIDGGTLGVLVSVQLFTTVIPLIIIGYSYLTGFADNVSPGTVFSRELGLVSPLTDHVRAAFGHSSGLRSSWTFLGVARFPGVGNPDVDHHRRDLRQGLAP